MSAPTTPSTTILRIDTSGRTEGSASRAITQHLVETLMAQTKSAAVIARDIPRGLPMVDGEWITAAYAEPSARTPAQRAKLAVSDELIAELQAADIIVIGLPMYNFAPPAAFKAWVDQIARARVTFRYSEKGIEGLLKGKKAYVVFVSGGVALGAPSDFVSPYVRHILSFVGIDDVTLIDSGRINFEGAAKIERAKADAVDALAARITA